MEAGLYALLSLSLELFTGVYENNDSIKILVGTLRWTRFGRNRAPI
jgi:hypothetical protein